MTATAYVYADAAGTPVYRTVRYPPKSFVQERADGAGGWRGGLNGVGRVPYRQPELHRVAEVGGTALVVEGEKDAERLAGELAAAGVGACAVTTSAGGAPWRWPKEWAEYFRGLSRAVVLA